MLFIGYLHKEGYFYKREYQYDGTQDVYVCPNGQLLTYRPPNRLGYREASQCANCPSKAQCTQSANGIKVVTRHVWQHFKKSIDANRLTNKGKELYKRRKETVERSFADAKELHGHRYARFRGLAKVKAQALLAAACQNMKKMARLLEEALRLLFRPFFAFTSALSALQSLSSTAYRQFSFHRHGQLMASTLADSKCKKPASAKKRGLSAV
jgi:hypothetical protein